MIMYKSDIIFLTITTFLREDAFKFL